MSAPAAAVVQHRGVTVRIYALADRARPTWLLAYHVGSRRKKQTCPGTLEDARRKAREVAQGLISGDLIDALHLTPLDRRVYLTAKEAAAKVGRPVDVLCREVAAAHQLAPGISPRELAEFWQRHHSTDLPAATPAEVADALFTWLAGKRRAGVTVKSLRSIYRKFSAAFPMPIAHIGAPELDRWLSSHLSHSPRTLRNYRSALVRLFNFAKGRFLPDTGPTSADRLESPSDDHRGAVAIFRPWEMARLLACAPRKLVPPLVLGAFAGIRTVELHRLEWSAIHFSDASNATVAHPHGFIEVSAAVAKQHRSAARRLVPIQPNLAAWLEPFRFEAAAGGRVCPYPTDQDLSRAITRFIRKLNEIEKAAHRPVISRPANGLRHSYGTYRLPVLGDVAALSLEMNNSPREIIENYRELAYPRDVESWWKITPHPSAEVIPVEFTGRSGQTGTGFL